MTFKNLLSCSCLLLLALMLGFSYGHETGEAHSDAILFFAVLVFSMLPYACVACLYSLQKRREVKVWLKNLLSVIPVVYGAMCLFLALSQFGKILILDGIAIALQGALLFYFNFKVRAPVAGEETIEKMS